MFLVNQYKNTSGVDILVSQVEYILCNHPNGLSEYRLIELLDQSGLAGFDKNLFSSSLSLFQAHFILFHALYLLNDRPNKEWMGVEIHCLKIILIPSSINKGQDLVAADPLREYYLDLNNLNDTDSEDVERLLNSFWQQYVAADHRQEALACLQLCDPISFDEIKSRYRKLVMEHHPDRGGDTQYFQTINTAMTVLEQYYPHS